MTSPLEVLCKQLELSIPELAALTEVPHPTLYHVRRGLRPIPEKVLNFLAGLGIDAEELKLEQAEFMAAYRKETTARIGGREVAHAAQS
jgi:hypothetical protein